MLRFTEIRELQEGEEIVQNRSFPVVKGHKTYSVLDTLRLEAKWLFENMDIKFRKKFLSRFFSLLKTVEVICLGDITLRRLCRIF